MTLANFSGKTIAIMVASGFDETAFIAIQRAMMTAGGKLKVVSREAGLTNAWSGIGWGMSYPADVTLSTTLAIALIVPSGSRHIESLKTEAHAKRVLRAFLREDMPILLQGEAISLIDLIEDDADRPKLANADKALVVDRNLVTITAASETLDDLKALNELMIANAGESFAA
jgi:protease I